MKKISVVLSFLFLTLSSSYGQWYVKKYQVTDINLLSKEQLEESLLKSNRDLLTSGVTAGAGALIFIIFKYAKPGMSEDPGVIEQLLGDKGVNKIGLIAGAGILIGGTIASIVYIGRSGRIKSIIRRNYPTVGSLDFSPAVILNSYTRSSCPGFTLTYNF